MDRASVMAPVSNELTADRWRRAVPGDRHFADHSSAVMPTRQAHFLKDGSTTWGCIEIEREYQRRPWIVEAVQRCAVSPNTERVVNPACEAQERCFIFLLKDLLAQRALGACNLAGRQDIGTHPAKAVPFRILAAHGVLVHAIVFAASLGHAD